MTIEATDKAAAADTILEALAAALGNATLAPQTRICASPDARSPEEGLALLGAYVAIEPPAVRQAILDAVLIISQQRARTRR